MAQKKAIQINLGSKEYNEGKKYLAQLEALDREINAKIKEYRGIMKTAEKVQNQLEKDAFDLNRLASDAQKAGASSSIVKNMQKGADDQLKIAQKLMKLTNKVTSNF
jgi:hypothetical protein